jgi:hypothetical protein
MFNNPMFRDTLNQIANRITSLEKDKEDSQKEKHDDKSD